MEVDPDWSPLLPPGERNQLDTTTLRLPIIPMHPTLGERDTAYPMLPKGCHQSRVDNTVHMGAAAKAAKWNEALGVVPPCSTMRPADCGFPQTVADWDSLFKATRKDGSNKAVQLARAYITQAQNMPGVHRTEPQPQALREWTYPAWFMPAPRKGKERKGPKLVGRQAAAPSGQPSVKATNLATTYATALPLPMFPDLPPPHADGWQPRHGDEVRLGMPMMRDNPEMWAAWIDRHPDKCPQGIVIMPDGRVSLHGIRGMQLIKWHNPRPAVTERQQTQYVFIAAQLFALPSAYWHALRQLRLTVVPRRLWAPYDGSIDNLTVDDLVQFFASQGMTEEEANDAFEYVYQWLTTAATTWVSQATEIQSLLGEVNLAIREAGNKLPRANGGQWWQPFFLQPAQLYAGQLPAEKRATLTAQYSPFDEPVEDSSILDLDYVGPIEASRHQSDPSDTVSLGHTSPKSSIGPPASRPMTRTTDPDFEMESGVAPSAPPASSALPMPAAAQDAPASLAQPSATSHLMSLTFVHPSSPIAWIDNPRTHKHCLMAMIP